MINLYKEYLDETMDANGVPLRFKIKPVSGFNFAYDCIDRLAQAEPRRRAMYWCNPAGEQHTFSFADLSEQSDRAAAWFQSLGIKKGDRVMLILKRHYQFWFAILGLHKIGAIAVPATNQLKAFDIRYRFDLAGISAIIVTMEDGVGGQVDQAAAGYADLRVKIAVNGRRRGWLDFDRGLAQAGLPFNRPVGSAYPCDDDTMLIYFTSGTTGLAKMVAHNFRYPLAHIVTARYWQKVNPEGLHLTVSETGWAKSMWGKLYGQWLMEAGIYVYDFDRFDPADLLQHMAAARITTFCAPPTIYRFLIHEQPESYDLSSLEHCTVAGEALHPEVFSQWKQATGLDMKEGFGQTETTLTIATFWWMDSRPGAMGQPSPLYKVRLLDPDGQPVKTGEAGEICLLAPENGGPEERVGMFKGYYNDPQLTAEFWHDGIYHTHDLARQDEAGYVWYIGRTDDMIKSSGYKISPFEVESILMEHDAVLECAVTGAPDPIRGQVIKASIVLARGFTASDELARDIKTFVKQTTAPYKYPREIEFVEELPKTISGKVRRNVIRGEAQR